jgi:hypothetical protein
MLTVLFLFIYFILCWLNFHFFLMSLFILQCSLPFLSWSPGLTYHLGDTQASGRYVSHFGHFSAFITLGKLAFNLAPHCRASGFWLTSFEILVVHGTRADSWNFCCSPLLTVLPPFHHTRLSPPCEVCDSLDRQHSITTLVFKCRVSYVTWYFAGYRVRKLVS